MHTIKYLDIKNLAEASNFNSFCDFFLFLDFIFLLFVILD
jgi:hypothetical protein